jgi:leader peptidase (prepilin peptidase) / N-methyltransferase
MLLLLAAVLGLLIGSFLNVVIHRVPRGQSLLHPGSHCPRCGIPVAARHNVPVLGWLLLRGRCAGCAAPISPRYPLVELGTGLLFVAVAGRLGPSPALPAFLYLAAVSVALAAIDLDVRRLPNAIVLPSYLVAAVLLAPASVAGGDWWAPVRGLLAMAALLAGYLAITVLYPGGMGFGDVKLAGLLGLYLGWLGWAALLVGTFAGFLLGAAAGVLLMLTRRAGRRTALPFGPAMLAGALLALFVATPLADWYGWLLTRAG